METITQLADAFSWIQTPEAWIGLLTLIILEIILGIDNIIFLSIIVDKLPKEQQDKARKIGLTLAMIMRLLLLISISWVMSLTQNIFSDISWRDLILILGGLFLVVKSVNEIFVTVEGNEYHTSNDKLGATTMGMALVQIAIIDMIFSLDSVITAVGMVDQISIMMIAVVVSVGVMMFAAKAIGDFVNSHPSMKVLALAFLIMIGLVLLAEGFDYYLPKNFIYGTMAISILVELLNMRRKKKEIIVDKSQNSMVCKNCGCKIEHIEE